MTSAGHGYAGVDLVLARNFAHAARTATIKRIVYPGGLGETGPDLSEQLASRPEVERELASTGVPVTVFRCAMIVGSGSASFEILRYLVERLPLMITPKWVDTPCQPIAVRKVIGYLVDSLDAAESTGRVFDIGGPDVRRYRDIMRLMAEELGLRRGWIIPVPVLTPRLSSCWIHLVTPLGHRIAKPLAEGLRKPVVCRDESIGAILPQPLLSVRDAIRAALSNIAEHHVETTWSMAGPIPGDPGWAGGAPFRDARHMPIAAPAWATFRAVCRVGGGHGWYAADWLWRICGWLYRRGRRPGPRRAPRASEPGVYKQRNRAKQTR